MKKSSKIPVLALVLAVAVSLAGCATQGSVGPRGTAGQTGATGSTGETGATGAPGVPGAIGATGPRGSRGAQGAAGKNGTDGTTGGAAGPMGATGMTGAPGSAGATGMTGAPGPVGAIGPQGIPGPIGATGPSAVTDIAQFFALMPSDNRATIAAGADVEFPQDGPNKGKALTRKGPSTFNLSEVGIYRVYFQVPVDEPGQLVVTLDGDELAYTVVGRATGTSQITSMVLVETTAINSLLTVRNPSGDSRALTISTSAGGDQPVAASLVIEKL
ncbi:MAG: hypothetical protein ABI053_03385 [Lacisediminihabitans sp.]